MSDEGDPNLNQQIVFDFMRQVYRLVNQKFFSFSLSCVSCPLFRTVNILVLSMHRTRMSDSLCWDGRWKLQQKLRTKLWFFIFFWTLKKKQSPVWKHIYFFPGAPIYSWSSGHAKLFYIYIFIMPSHCCGEKTDSGFNYSDSVIARMAPLNGKPKPQCFVALRVFIEKNSDSFFFKKN